MNAAMMRETGATPVLDATDAVAPLNAFTIDVEDYFQVSAFESAVGKERWVSMPSRVQANTERILELLALYNVHATFFVLGWVAERAPQLIKRIAEQGHEVASHGREHTRITEQSPAQFRQDITWTKALLEDLTGQLVLGYRAASFSIGANNLWALDVIADAAYQYSSSIYPVHHDLYGMPEAPRFPYRVSHGKLLEIPITTVRLFGRNIPCGGGGYFRLFPYAFSRWAFKRINTHELQPGVFYFHPWEIDPEQPRIDGISRKARFRHYLNLGRMQGRLQRLLTDFQWGRMDRVFGLLEGAT
jgi:polysaccharide deacetylase family protein (PEP-CTERM system associated)